MSSRHRPGMATLIGSKGSHRAPRRRRLTPLRLALLMMVLFAQVAYLATSSLADGGDFMLDFASATPGTYDQSTGRGGTWDDVVQQLEGGDFACGDVVQHLTEITVDSGATGTQDIAITYSFDTTTTSGGLVGYGDVTYAEINLNDPNNILSGNETVTLTDEQVVGDQIIATVEITGLEAGEVLILSMGAQLECQESPSNVTGNIHAALESAETSLGDPINSGQDDTPLIGAGELSVPGIEITKSCTPDASTGEDITYEITITNTGNETLTIDSVIDTVLGDITSSFPATLGAGLSDAETFTHTVTPADGDSLTNSVTVNATGDTSGTSATSTAQCTTTITQLVPDILVEKSCDAEVPVGGTVTYTITVTNSGTEPLENITVDDTLLGDLSGSFPDTLDPGDFHSEQVTRDQQPGDPDPIENIVTAEADGVFTTTHVTSTANCLTDVTHVPGVEVTKSCSPEASIGDTVFYTITVTNTGNEPLVGIEVFDTVLGNLGSFANTLGVGESESHEFSHVVTAEDPDPLENTVGVVAFGQDSGDQATSLARCESDVTHVHAIDVEKSCEASAPVGDDIDYTITVTNTGESVLDDVTVVDSLLGDLSGLFSDTFEPGQSESVQVERRVLGSDPNPLTNTVTATGTAHENTTEGVTDVQVTDADSCRTTITQPAIPVTGADVSGGVRTLLMLILAGGLFLFFGTRRPQFAMVGHRRVARHGAHASGSVPWTVTNYRGSHRR
jgi:uncharacterized repeat protein (TIGR01451 family)